MASLATTENCPYCLQNINQGQSQYGPICNNGHRAHLNCIMNQFDSNGTFNIDTWTCPMCRAPAYYSPDSGIPSLNQVLRERFPRRIADLEEEEYSSEEETDMEETPDDSQGAFDAYAEALPANEPLEAVNRMNQLITHFPFLGRHHRPNEQVYVDSIINGLSAQVRMRGVFHESAEFEDTVDAANMADILLTQWYNMYNIAEANEAVRNEYRTGYGMDQVHHDVTSIEEAHSSLSNQSEFFRALTMAILLGHARGFWNLEREQVLLLTDMRRRAAQADAAQTGGKRKKKTRRKRGRGNGKGTKRKRDGPTTPRRPPRRRPNPAPEPLENEEDDYDEYEELMNHIADNVDPDDPNFTQGGRRRKRKTRKKRGGMDAPPTPPRPPKDNDRGTNRYPPGFTLPPPEVPVRIAQPQQVRMRRRGSRERFRDIHPGARAPTQRMLDEANERLRRSQNSTARNMFGDLVEKCTGSRCGLGGRRKKKHKRKTRKKKTRRKRGSHHEPLLLAAVAVSKLINKKRKKKYRKRRTKKKSRKR